jgi:hypothetical protein
LFSQCSIGHAAAGSCVPGALIKFVSGVFGFFRSGFASGRTLGDAAKSGGAAALSQVRTDPIFPGRGSNPKSSSSNLMFF